MPLHLRRFVCVVLALLAGSCGASALLAAEPQLWTNINDENQSAARSDGGIAISVDRRWLLRSGDDEQASVALPAIAGRSASVILDRTRFDRANRFVSSGRLDGQPGSSFLSVVDGDRIGAMIAFEDDVRYLILPTERAGEQRLIVTQSADIPWGAGIRPTIAAEESRTRDRVARRVALPAKQSSADAAAPTIIDVLILYTLSAKRIAGGGTPGIEMVADLAIEAANEAYEQSGALQRLRLAHTAEIFYHESGTAQTDLEHLTRAADGVMDDAITLRRDYRADLVHLFVGFADEADAGWINDYDTFNATWTFSVSTAIYVQDDAFTRAIGWNQGLDHDWYERSPAVYPYSFGYTFGGQSGRTYSTIMSNGAGRIRRHSNPTVLYDGVPMGRAIDTPNPAHAVLSLNNTAPTIAAIANNEIVPPPVISSPTTASGTVELYFEYQITATNGPLSFGAAGLPSGLTYNSTTGLISGYPRTAGVYRIDLSASNSGGTGVKVLMLTIDEQNDCPVERVARRLPTLTAAAPLHDKRTLVNASPQTMLEQARRFRDVTLKATPEGRRLIEHYYRLSPQWLSQLQERPQLFREVVVEMAAFFASPDAVSTDGRIRLTRAQHRLCQRVVEALQTDDAPPSRSAMDDVRVWLSKAVDVR